MARVPVITSPCPLRFREAPTPGKDFCGQCQRRVYNLDLMTTAGRDEFLLGCSGEICVSYSLPRARRLPIALGVGLAAIAAVPISNADDVSMAYGDTYIENPYGMGGTEAGAKLQWIDESEVRLPEKADLPDIAAATWLPTPKT